MDKAFNIIVPLKKFSLEWSFLAIMMFYPFVATISIFLRIPSRPLSVTYRFCYLVLVLFVLFIEKSKIGKQNIKYSKYFVYLSLFWLLYLLRMYYDLILCGLKVGYASNGFAYYFQYGILGSFLPALVFLLCHREINFRSLFKKLKFFSWPLALCLLYIIDHEFGLNSQIFLSRIYLGEDANIINPIVLSQYGGFIAFIAFYNMKMYKINISDLVLLLLGFLILVIGSSRGPLLAFVVTILFISVDHIKTKFRSLKLWRNIIIILLFISFLTYKLIIPNLDKIDLITRVEKSVNEGQGLDIRSMQWKSAWNQFLENPIVGDLIIERVMFFYPHNIVLEILMSPGILGGLLFLIMILKIIKNFLNVKDQYKRFVLYGFLINFLFAMFSLSLITMPQFWCFFALSLSLMIPQFSKLS